MKALHGRSPAHTGSASNTSSASSTSTSRALGGTPLLLLPLPVLQLLPLLVLQLGGSSGERERPRFGPAVVAHIYLYSRGE